MTEKSFKLPAFAKINWYLRVFGKRADDFHEICTLFQTISLKDELSFEENDELILSCNHPEIPTDETNLIIKAAKLLQKEFNTKRGARIYLDKQIPSPGGLGGGSADAAVALLGLAKLWNLNLEIRQLREIGANLGSDVPFFFEGGTASAFGRGTEIVATADIEEKFLLVVTPEISVSTAAAYAKLNAPRLTISDSKSNLEFCRREMQKSAVRQMNYQNDFEKTVFETYSEVGRVKQELLKNGAKVALMSGSGASVFGIFEKEETRQATIKAFQEEFNWRMFAVATVSRSAYRRALNLC